MKLGVHISAAAPFSEAITRAKTIGCECMQIFVNNPERWNPAPIAKEQIDKFVELNKNARIDPVVIHGIYLINLASYNPFFYKASIRSLVDDMVKADQLNALGVNFHIGSTLGREEKTALKKVVDGIKEILASTPKKPYLIFENSAGAGHIIGDKFEELADIIEKVNSPRIKITLDTAHMFESGYDIKTEEGLKKTIERFNKIIGLDRLVCLHLNDSQTALASNRDRHADIGGGLIGAESFKRIVNHPKLKNVPGIIETPNLKGKSDIDNLKILKDMRK